MIELLGNLGDFIGGVAVLVTIGYLAVQTRRNTQVNRIATYQSLLNHIADWNALIITEEGLSELLSSVAKEGLGELAPAEYTKVRTYMGTSFRHFENAFLLYHQGAIDERQFNQLTWPVSYVFSSKAYRELWGEVSEVFDPEFRSYIADVTGKRDG